MIKEQAIEFCQSFPLYGSVTAVQDNLDKWLNGDTTFSVVSYILNMLNSDNLPWIDCMLSVL